MDQKTIVYLHNGNYTTERKKELLPFIKAWMELGSIMLSEIKENNQGTNSEGKVTGTHINDLEQKEEINI